MVKASAKKGEKALNVVIDAVRFEELFVTRRLCDDSLGVLSAAFASHQLLSFTLRLVIPIRRVGGFESDS